MSENTRTVVERAQQEAERQAFKADGPSFPYAWMRGFEGGAAFAATITPEQVEAAAREIQNIERNAGNVAGIEWCRRRVHAIFAAAGFQIGADS